MSDTSEGSLDSTAQKCSLDCPQFRILVVGKTGCGKSSLINRVFGVDVAQVSHNKPGEASIEEGFNPNDNNHFVLHDSRGFEAGDSLNYDLVKSFIEERTNLPLLKDRLHAIWVCISIPSSGDRLLETGVKSLWNINRHNIPLIVVFTKYDRLVTDLIGEADDEISEQSEEEIWAYGEREADATLKKLCIDPLFATVGEVPFVKVSSQLRYKSTIEKLIQVTDQQVLQSVNGSSHINPVSLAWAVAQRGDPNVSMEASIDVGRERYWKGLISSIDFTGKKLRQCLEVIHTDIISVWNIRDPHKYLAGDEFKSTMSRLVEDLVPPPRPSVSIAPAGTALATAPGTFGIVVASLWSAILFAQWVQGVYENAPENIACIMGYIVDLTLVMRKLSDIDLDISKRTIKTTLEDFTRKDITNVHHDIRKFLATKSTISLTNKDHILDEIIKLIHKYASSST